MEEEGLVLEIKGKIAKVQLRRKSACGLCGACRLGSGNTMIVEAENEVGAHPGERVKIEISSPYYLMATMVVYIFPLIGLVGGAIIGEKVIGSELAVACFGAVGLLLSLGIIYGINCWCARRPKRKAKLNPKIIRVK